MQKRAAIWILGVFQTSPFFGIKAIVRLIPIYLHFCKLSSRAQLRVHALPNNYILQSLLKSRPLFSNNLYHFLLDLLSPYQREIIKGPVIDIDNRFNEVFPSFDPHNREFSPGSWLIDTFLSRFSFHSFNKCNNNNLKACLCQLNDLLIISSSDPLYALVVMDTSIKNNVANSITHIHVHNKPIIKILHYAMNVTTTKAKLFAIRCDMNYATDITSIFRIVIIMDPLHTTQRIFNSSSNPFQIHFVAILNKLRSFFLQNQNNSIEFWKCPSCYNWLFHKAVDRETK